jgi:outer membrane lipoprotein-sorting protein
MRQMALQRRARLVFTALVMTAPWLAVSASTPSGENAGGAAPAFVASLAADDRRRDLFDEIYERGRPIEQSLKTVRARFTEETTSSLLVKPLLAEGTLVVVRPSDVLLTYTKPERKTLRLDEGRLLFVWPDRGLRETKDIRESQARVQRYFLSKSPDELRRHFTIVASEDKTRAGTWRIDMTPTRKQMQQGLSRLELWVRQDALTLAAMRMTFPGGDTKTMTFTDVVLNQPVTAAELNTP